MVMHWICNPENGDRYLVGAPFLRYGIMIVNRAYKIEIKSNNAYENGEKYLGAIGLH